jgi:phasin family protein
MEAELADLPNDKPIAKPQVPTAAKKPLPAKSVPLAAKPAEAIPEMLAAKPAPKPISFPVAANPAPVDAKPLPVAPKPLPVAAKPAPVAAKPAVARPVPPKAVSPVTAKPMAPKPVIIQPAATVKTPVAPAPVILAKAPVVAKPPVAAEAVSTLVPPAVSLKAPLSTEGKATVSEAFTKIEETAKNFAAEATTKVKAAMEKGQKGVGEVVEFSKGNIEAVVASGKIAAKGAEEIAKYATDYGRTSIEKANATAKQFSSVKSPTEFFQLQSEIAKTSLEAFVGEASKFGENYMKLLGEIAQPIQNRYALAVEKVKTAVAV